MSELWLWLLFLGTASADPLTPADVAARVLAVDPDVAAAQAEVERAELLVRGETHKYGLRLGYGAAAQRNATPRMFGTEAFVGTSDSVTGSVNLTVETALGTDVILAVDGTRGTSTTLIAPNIDPLVNGPTTTGQARLTIRQDLASPGLIFGASGRRQAVDSLDVAMARALDAASGAVRDALGAWWELVHADEAARIDAQALVDARAALDEAKRRVGTGSLAPIEALSWETTVATREEAVAVAAAERARRIAAVQRDLSLDAPPELGAPDWSAPPPIADAEARALERAPAVIASRASLALAQEQARTAGAALRPALSAEGWLQSNALVDVSGASVGPTQAISMYLGLTGTLDVDRTRYRTERERADLAVRAAEEQLRSAELTVTQSVRELDATWEAATRRVSLAERTVQVAREQRAGVRAKVASGTSLPLELRQAEQDVRDAELRLLRARVDVMNASTNLAHLTGALVVGE
jgi:outer membrane protein